jgi:hypothetical protein
MAASPRRRGERGGESGAPGREVETGWGGESGAPGREVETGWGGAGRVSILAEGDLGVGEGGEFVTVVTAVRKVVTTLCSFSSRTPASSFFFLTKLHILTLRITIHHYMALTGRARNIRNIGAQLHKTTRWSKLMKMLKITNGTIRRSFIRRQPGFEIAASAIFKGLDEGAIQLMPRGWLSRRSIWKMHKRYRAEL